MNATAPRAWPATALRLARWLALPSALLAAASGLLHTESGLRFALARADAALGGGLEVAAARGTLAGPLELEGLVLTIGGTRLEVARLALDLRSTPLLLGRLHLLRLEAEGVRVAVAPDPAAPPFVLPERIELPLHLALERFAIRDLEVRVGDAAPLAFASVSGGASVDARGLRFDDLVVDHARGRLRGRGSLALAQPYPAEAAIALLLARPGAEPLLTTVTIGGRLEALSLQSWTAAPLALHADLTLHDAFTAPRLVGRVECDALQPAAADAALAPLGPTTLDCALEVTAAAGRGTVAGRLRATHPEWRPAVLDLTLALAPDAVQLERGALRFEGAPLRADVSGRLGLADPAWPFALAVEAHDLGLPTRVPGPVRAATARLDLRGDLDAARATLALRDRATGTLEAEATLAPRARRFALDAKAQDIVAAGLTLAQATLHAEGDAAGADLEAAAALRAVGQPAALTARGRLTPQALVLDDVALTLLDGRVAGDARLDFGGADARGAARPPRWRAALAARDLDPRALDPRFRGRLAGRIAIEGTPASTRVALTGLGGTLRERAIGGEARLRYAPRTPRTAPLGPWFAPELALESLALTSGGARVEAAFDASRGRLTLEAADLADLLPAARGRLTARGTVDGDGSTLSADGAGLVLGGLRLATLAAAIEAPAAGAVAASVVARGLDVGDLIADEVAFGAAGPRDALTLTLDAQAGAGRLRAEARGALGPRAFSGSLARLELTPAEGAPWALAAPAALGIGRDGLSIAEACLVGGGARGCLGGAWHPTERWRVAGQVRQLAVGAFGALFARGLDYRGTLDLEFDATGEGPTLGDSQAVLTLSAGSIVQPPRRARRDAKGAAPPTAATLLDFDGGRVELARKGQRNALDARFALVGGGRLDAQLGVVGTGPFERRALDGRVRADLSQFALLPALLPELKSLTGRVVADVAVAGTVGEPRYSGRVALEGGSAALPQYGLELSEVGAELTGDGAALAFSGSARSGGVLHWRADMRRDDGRWRASGRVWGERVKVVDTPEARVVATPALLLELDGDDLKVTGEVVVPRAKLAPRSLATAVQATGDEVIIDPDGAGTRDDALRIDARVRLRLGDEVEFDGFGLTAKVRGEIAVTEKPGALAIASGELALVDGKYEAYGQDLTIERGRLLFSGGPVTNPGLDVRAQRTVERPTEDEDVVVGIDVRGTLRSPETTIFATPAMSSSDALAYLVVGRPLADSTDAEQSQLSDAASSMKLSGGEFLAQQIGRRIGLDEVRVADGDDPEEAQLWLGTYLSPRLFVSYGMGLFEQFHTARVRYTISSKWSVEAESGRESSADFKYTIER